MNKFFLFSILLLGSLSLLQAQENLRYGLKAGANLSGFHTKNSTQTDRHGFQFGAIINYQALPYFALQAELNYLQKGGSFSTTQLTSASYPNFLETQLDYIELPVTAQLIIFKKFRLELGPQVSVLIQDQSKLDGQEIEVEVNNLDLGLTGGLSYDFGTHFFLQARYTYGLSEVYAENDRYKNSVVSLSLGYLF